MPAPSGVHIDTFLTGIAACYKNDSYIAEAVLPIMPVAKETGKIGAYGTDHYRVDFGPRAMGSKAPRVEWATTTAVSFAATEWTLETPIDDRMRAIYDDPFDADADGTMNVMEKVLLKREILVATLMSTSGNFGDATAGTAWGTVATGTPVTDIRAAMRRIVARSGVSRRNMACVMSDALWEKLIKNNEVKNLYLNTIPGAAAPGNVTPNQIAAAIGIGEIIVGAAVKLTSNEGATDVFADCWSSTTCGVFCKTPNPSPINPSFGALISPTVPGFKGATVAIDKYREEAAKSDIIRATALYDQIVVNKNMGSLITTIT